MSKQPADESLMTEWLESGDAFVFYRYPGTSEVQGVRSAMESVRQLSSIEELNGGDGFVFSPFCISETNGLWLLPATEKVNFHLNRMGEAFRDAPAPAHIPSAYRPVPILSSDYSVRFGQFSEVLHTGEFEKLVLSRSHVMPCPQRFSPEEAFRAACRRYVHSYVYLLYIPQTGFWLGATPEILLASDGRVCHTMALAGTQYLQDGVLAEEWSAKNLREQQLVTDFIVGKLQAHHIAPSLKGPYTVTAGELAHLRTDIVFELPQWIGQGNILRTLHPTPAVCGLPAGKAFDFIAAHEGHDRNYYAGFLGEISSCGKTAVYVNLRCMQWERSGSDLTLYAGSGLLSSSVLEEEWMETERKLQTMTYVIEKGVKHVF